MVCFKSWLLPVRGRSLSLFVLVVLLFASLCPGLVAHGGEGSEVLVGVKVGSEIVSWPKEVIRVRLIPGSNIYRLRVETSSVERVITELKALEAVEFVEKSRSHLMESYTAEPYGNGPAWQDSIEAEVIARLDVGTGSVVAVIDTGIDLDNPMFGSRLFRNPGEIPDDGIDNDSNGYIDDVNGWNFGNMNNGCQDYNGHGTSVTSVCLGVAPGSIILPVKVNNGSSNTFGTGDLVEGIFYAIASGAVVLNLSLGADTELGAVLTAVKAAEDAGVVVVAASGNSGGGVDFPAAVETVIAVGALDESGEESAWFSGKGPELDLIAPGTSIETVGLGGGGVLMTGTSFSTPMVSGAAAVLRSMNPHLVPETVRYLLFTGALDLGDPGRDPDYGYGALKGSGLWVSSLPGIVLPMAGSHTYSGESIMTAGFYLPPTDTETDIFAGIIRDDNIWWLGPEGEWHDSRLEDISKLVSLSILNRSVDGLLFGDDGVFPAKDMSGFPPGEYFLGTAIADQAGNFLGPVTMTPMILE